MVMQETFLFNMTIRENIKYGRADASDEEMIAAARAANAHEFVVEMPDGYDTMIGEKGVRLSGGQRQRIAIARAIVVNPRVLILDEATSAVDTRTDFLIQQALDRLMEGRTTFVIAHRLTTAQRADEILVLSDGAVAARGPHRELLESSPQYRTIYETQLRRPEDQPAPALAGTAAE
jgi:ABC-type multidrug transport system fused ATPase/permease subunit